MLIYSVDSYFKRSQKKLFAYYLAWMIQVLFVEWFKQILFLYSRSTWLKSILCSMFATLESSFSHPQILQYMNLNAKGCFLPPNVKSLKQPLDWIIIKTIKVLLPKQGNRQTHPSNERHLQDSCAISSGINLTL